MSFRASSGLTAGDAAGTTIAFTPPAAWANGDIVTLQLYLETLALTPSFDKQTWTKITTASGENNNAGIDFAQHVYWCRWDTSITGDVTISWGGTNTWRVVVATSYSGRLAAGDPQDATATYNELESLGTTVTCNAVTTAHTNADVVASATNNSGSLHSSWTGVTERVDFGGSSLADTLQAASGSSGNKTVTIGSSTWSAGLMAIREAAAAGDTQEWRGSYPPQKRNTWPSVTY